MTPNDRDDVTLEHLPRLPTLAADSKRAALTRQRCRAMLGRRQHRKHAFARIESTRPGRGPMTAGAFFLFCVVYLSELVATTLRLQGIIR